MPEILYCLSESEAAVLGVSGADVELARAPYMNRSEPAATINWPLVERAAAELTTDTQGFARILLAARADQSK